MPSFQKLRSQLTAFHGLLVLVSGLLWIALWLFNKQVMSFSEVTGGINLIYLPAGFRLLIVLIFGFWGALGVFIADPILFSVEFGSGSWIDILTTAAVSGFVPWIAVRLFFRAAKLKYSILELRPVHLPLLALALSAITPLAFNVQFVLSGKHAFHEFLRNYTAMAAGDFLGCLIVIVFVKFAIGSARYLFDQRP